MPCSIIISIWTHLYIKNIIVFTSKTLEALKAEYVRHNGCVLNWWSVWFRSFTIKNLLLVSLGNFPLFKTFTSWTWALTSWLVGAYPQRIKSNCRWVDSQWKSVLVLNRAVRAVLKICRQLLSFKHLSSEKFLFLPLFLTSRRPGKNSLFFLSLLLETHWLLENNS